MFYRFHQWKNPYNPILAIHMIQNYHRMYLHKEIVKQKQYLFSQTHIGNARTLTLRMHVQKAQANISQT